ncbi:MAG: trimeric intracellular cation channel family protein [Flavobacteriales bacterium]
MEIINILDIIGTGFFAVSGALSAMNKRLDLFGVFIVSGATAIGGGTIRDLLIGDQPVAWIKSLVYPTMILIGYLLAVLFRKKLSYLRKTFFIFDTVGLAIFTIIGVKKGLYFGIDPILCIMLGMMTGTFGGVVRDILVNDVPLIFRREIYALASVSGGLLFIILYKMGVTDTIIYISTVLTVIAIRTVVVCYNISLPTIYHDKN